MGQIYKMIEVVGTSPTSYAEATKAALAGASKTIREMRWFEVSGLSGSIADGKVREFQVKLKVGFKVEQ